LNFLIAQPSWSETFHCQNTEKIDVKNFKIMEPDTAENGGGSTIEVKNGKGSEFWNINKDHPRIPEFDLRVKESFIFEASPKVKLQVINLQRVHRRGAGSGNATLILQCKNKQIIKVFYDDGEADIRDGKLHLQESEDLGADGAPLENFQWQLMWDDKLGVFNKVNTEQNKKNDVAQDPNQTGQ
jgi:hypothetical protein